MIATAQRQCSSHSCSIEHVKLKLIKQFPVTYVHIFECLHTVCLIGYNCEACTEAFDFMQATTGCLIVTQILQYMFDRT